MWLAPTAHDVDYCIQHLESAQAKRQPHTCEWILSNARFMEWSGTIASQGSFLWLYAKPGAGKTVLSSFLINHLQHKPSPSVEATVFYFFCNDNDGDRKTPVAVVKSLLYQLLLNTTENQDSLVHALESAMDKSSQSKAGNYSSVWKIFSDHIGNLSTLTIIVDALDECENPGPMIQGLKKLTLRGVIKVLLTSRKEQHLVEELEGLPSFEITTQDVGSDIKAFIEEKVTRSPRLSREHIREKVVSKLSKSHEGMFLWADLMLMELKSCYSISSLEQTLDNLP